MLRLPLPARTWKRTGSLKRIVSFRLRLARPTPSSLMMTSGTLPLPARRRSLASRPGTSRAGSTS